MFTLVDGASRILKVCAGVKKGEKVVMITDDDKLPIALGFREAARKMEVEAITVIMNKQEVGGQEPPAPVAAAMFEADVIVGLTTYSLSQTNTRVEATRRGARMINLPDVQMDDVTGSLIEADFPSLSNLVNKVATILTNGNSFHITSSAGTDITFDGTGRKGRALDAMAHEPRTFRSLSVEANIGPVEGSARGRIVIDGSLPLIGPLEQPIECEIVDGKIVKITGGPDAERFAKTLEAYNDPNMYVVGEFGIGLNPCAKVTGKSYLADESALGTVHFGFGTNISQGGTIKAVGHFDAVILLPTIEIDGTVIMQDGKLLV